MKLGDTPTAASNGGGLRRDVGPWSLATLTINCVVGAGVLGLPGRVFALARPLTPWVLVTAGVLALGVPLCVTELAGRFDGMGGPVMYLDRAFGRAAGFAAGWLSWSATVLGAASLLDLLVGTLPDTGSASRWPEIMVISVEMTALAMAGARRSASASALVSVFKVALLATVALAALLGPAEPARWPGSAPHPIAALVLVFFAFAGFERPTAIVGEVKGARRNVPLALMAAMLAIIRLILRRKTSSPAALNPTRWKTSLPISMPITVGGVVL